MASLCLVVTLVASVCLLVEGQNCKQITCEEGDYCCSINVMTHCAKSDHYGKCFLVSGSESTRTTTLQNNSKSGIASNIVVETGIVIACFVLVALSTCLFGTYCIRKDARRKVADVEVDQSSCCAPDTDQGMILLFHCDRDRSIRMKQLL